MKKNYLRYFSTLLLLTTIGLGTTLYAQQLPDPGFEDWNGEKFEGNIQPTYWHGSNVSQSVMNVNFTERKEGHTGYCVYVADKDVKFMSIGATSPGYISLGTPWSWLSGLNISGATAGTYGGISFTYRPDAMKVWIKRTGSNTAKENYNIIFYSWKGTAVGSSYKNKGYTCSSPGSPYNKDEESDIRIALNKNMCATTTPGTQVAEGWIREKKTYSNWTQITIPIYYLNSEVPEKTNVIFSAGNYPNFRDNDGIYDGNDIYVDDVELVYYSTIEELYIDGMRWDGFDPNSSDEQVYSLGSDATAVPDIYGMRGKGTLTNDPPTHDDFAGDYSAMKATVNFPGRRLSSSEMTVTKGQIGEVTTITVKAEDGSSTTTYKIRFVKAVSTNATPQNIEYTLAGETKSLGFSGTNYDYTVSLPYGTTEVPQLKVTLAEGQTMKVTQPTSANGKGTVVVTAADGKTSKTYTVNFTVEKLTDNTLQDILINGVSLPGFSPTGARFKYTLTSAEVPTVTPVSAYPAGEQTITVVYNNLEQGCKIEVSAPGNTTTRTYTISYSVEQSGNTLLADLRVEGYDISFDPSTKNYTVNLPLDATTLPAVSWTAGDSQQTIEADASGMSGLTGVYKVVVTSGKGTTATYRITFTQAQSSVKTLKAIYVNGTLVEGFSASTTSYTVTLPEGTTAATITWEQGDKYQTVRLQQETVNVNGRNVILVTAGDGSSAQYIVTLEVQKSEDNTLKMIYLDGVELTGFSEDTEEYNVTLPVGTTQIPDVTCNNGGGTWPKVTVSDQTRNGSGDYRLTVKPESGTNKVYILHFSVTSSSNTALSMIQLDGVNLDNFSADQTEYTITLEVGKTRIPTVTFTKQEESQKVTQQTQGDKVLLTVTAESGDKRVYTLTFVRQMSANALLNMIYLNGDSLEGFSSNTLEYTVTLQDENRPTVTVDKDETQSVSIQSSIGYGTTTIIVTPQTGESNTYLVHFVPEVTTDNLLQNIMVDGVALTDFASDKFDYTYTYYTVAMPEVSYEAKEGQTVRQLQQNGVVTLLVTANQQTVTYTVTLVLGNVELSNDATLESITLSAGQLTPAFDAQTTDYTVTLAAGTAIPEVSYQAKAGQTVAAGAVSSTKYQILVRAEDGTTEKTYTVVFNYETAACVTPYVDNIYLDGTAIEGFASDNLSYSVMWKKNALPTLSFDKGDNITVVVTQTGTREHTVIVSNDCAETRYVIHYAEEVHNNAVLTDIRVNAVLSPAFAPTTYEYTLTLDDGIGAVPCMTPIAGEKGQTIEVRYGKIGADTKIHVRAEGGAEADYVIHVVANHSSEATLASILIDGFTLDGFESNKTDYEIQLDEATSVVPKVTWKKKDPEQTTVFTFRPLNEVSTLTVTSEDGTNSITYNLRFVNVEKRANTLTAITIEGAGRILLGDNDEVTAEMPYGTQSINITSIEKGYESQTVIVENGGILSSTRLIVKSNRYDVADKIYTINPYIEKTGGALLKGITIDGVELSNFVADQFSYIVNIDNTIPAVDGIAEDGATVTVGSTSSKKKRTITIEKDGESNTYNLHFYYQNDIIPNGEFTDWTKAKYNNGSKPVSWSVPADFAEYHKAPITNAYYYSGGEVTQNGDIAVLNTCWSSQSLGGSFPGMITLANMNISYGSANGTSSSITGNGVSFRNTPQGVAIRYNPVSATKVDNIRFYAVLRNGNATDNPGVYTDGNFNNEWREHTLYFNGGVTEPQYLNIVINAAESENAGSLQGGYNLVGESNKAISTMYVDWVRLVYNSKLKSVTVDGEAATISGTDITYNIADAEYHKMPELRFVGEVEDQMPVITWLERGKTANIRNYAEDGSYTDYTLTLTRPESTDCTLQTLRVGGAQLSDFSASKTDYVYEITDWNGILPDVEAVTSSIHAKLNLTVADRVVTMHITAENGDEKTYTLEFRDAQYADGILAGISAEGAVLSPAYSMGVTDYNLVMTQEEAAMLTIEKQSWSQTATEGAGEVRVLAQDGVTEEIYSFNTILQTSGLLASIEADNTELAGYDPETFDYKTSGKPSTFCFVREFSSDSIYEVLTDDKVTLSVFGDENSPVYSLLFNAALSDNTELGGILIDGVSLPGFTPDNYYPETEAREGAEVSVIAGAEGQTIDVTSRKEGDNKVYEIVVTAPDRETKATYILTLLPLLSDNTELIDILCNGVSVGLEPGKYEYTYTVPLENPGQPKLTEQTMPSVTYVARQGQTVYMQLGTIGGITMIEVTAEDGVTTETYVLNIEAEKSHYAYLSDILVANTPVSEVFDPQTNSYTLLYVEAEVGLNDIQTFTKDLYQKSVEITGEGDAYKVVVTAEDETTTMTYNIYLVRRVLSSDALLYDLKLDNMSFEEFVAAGKGEIAPAKFQPATTQYTVTLPQGTEALPDVQTIAKNDKQVVGAPVKNGNTVSVSVQAEDGTTAEYIITFVITRSTNADLSSILVGGQPIADFSADKLFYQIVLEEGVRTYPDVEAQKAEDVQTVEAVTTDNLTTIKVTAENPDYQKTYIVMLQFTPSAADTLKYIYSDGEVIKGFNPNVFVYNYTLEGCNPVFPHLDYEGVGEPAQTVKAETLYEVADSAACYQLTVTAENGSHNNYLINYTVLHSTVDTLQGIYVGGQLIEGFSGGVNDYQVQLERGTAELPEITWLTGDECMQQEVVIEKGGVNGLTRIMVTAPAGNTRVYTINFSTRLSDNALLRSLEVGGKTVEGFDEETFSYIHDIAYGFSSLPIVTFQKQEEAQSVEIEQGELSVKLKVTAEDGITTAEYVINFNVVMSDNAYLLTVYFDGERFFEFQRDVFEYHFTVDYTVTERPEITWLAEDTLQTVYLEKLSPLAAKLIVYAPNKEDYNEYSFYFDRQLCYINWLDEITLRGQQIEGFHPDTLEYTIDWPVATPLDSLYVVEDVDWTKSEEHEAVEASIDENNTIILKVQAEDGSIRNYVIHQNVTLSDVAYLNDIIVGGNSLNDFDSARYEYTYILLEGEIIPDIQPVAPSEDIQVSVTLGEIGEATNIYCIAPNGRRVTYSIVFKYIETSTADKATERDVLLRHLKGSRQFMAYTTKQNVQIALYDIHGTQLMMSTIPICNPNMTVLGDNTDDLEFIYNVLDAANGVVIEIPQDNMPYFYAFYYNYKERLKSGKIMLTK